MTIGALIGIGVGVKEGLAPTVWGTTMFVVMQVVALIANALVLVGVIRVARSGVWGRQAGKDRPRSRLVRQRGSSAVGTIYHLQPGNRRHVVRYQRPAPRAGPAAGGDRRGAGGPLARLASLDTADLWSLYLPGAHSLLALVLDGYNAWALVGWQIPFALLGLALYQQGPAASAVDPVAVGS